MSTDATSTDLTALARELVSTRILGHRKNSTEPAWQHSERVASSLERHGFPRDVILAGWLHDLVEDSDPEHPVTLEDLRALGFGDRTVALVDLATHSSASGHAQALTQHQKDQRWARMLKRLTGAAERDAWAVKLSDVTDNLRGCFVMPLKRQIVFYQLKAPVYLELSADLLGDSGLYAELLEEFVIGARRLGLSLYRDLLGA
jgi:(p)ppGpp synthase/HD superfamily hydrolase